MKQFTRTLTLAGAAALLAAGQLCDQPAHTAPEAVFQPYPESAAGLEGLQCVSKKLILPEEPDTTGGPAEPEKPDELRRALARYGE